MRFINFMFLGVIILSSSLSAKSFKPTSGDLVKSATIDKGVLLICSPSSCTKNESGKVSFQLRCKVSKEDVSVAVAKTRSDTQKINIDSTDTELTGWNWDSGDVSLFLTSIKTDGDKEKQLKPYKTLKFKYSRSALDTICMSTSAI
jgi:hypothetical protein